MVLHNMFNDFTLKGRYKYSAKILYITKSLFKVIFSSDSFTLTGEHVRSIFVHNQAHRIRLSVQIMDIFFISNFDRKMNIWSVRARRNVLLIHQYVLHFLFALVKEVGIKSKLSAVKLTKFCNKNMKSN